MPLNNNESLSPREHFLLENDNEQGRLMREHALRVKELDIQGVKVQIQLRQEDATKSRLHQEHMKEVELAIRTQETKWGQLLRIPVLIIKLPILFLFGLAYIVSAIRGEEIESTAFWQFLR